MIVGWLVDLSYGGCCLVEGVCIIKTILVDIFAIWR